MRLLEAGVGDDGRSRFVRTKDLEPGRPNGLWRAETPPPLPAGVTTAATMDLLCPPGMTKWIHFQAPAGYETGMHRTDTVDLDIVIAGSVELILDEGTETLNPGDAVILSGANHAWRAGPDGFTMAYIIIGTHPPAGAAEGPGERAHG